MPAFGRGGRTPTGRGSNGHRHHPARAACVDMPIRNWHRAVLDPIRRGQMSESLRRGAQVPQPPLSAPSEKPLVHHLVGSDVDNVRNEGPRLIEITDLEQDPGQNSRWPGWVGPSRSSVVQRRRSETRRKRHGGISGDRLTTIALWIESDDDMCARHRGCAPHRRKGQCGAHAAANFACERMLHRHVVRD